MFKKLAGLFIKDVHAEPSADDILRKQIEDKLIQQDLNEIKRQNKAEKLERSKFALDEREPPTPENVVDMDMSEKIDIAELEDAIEKLQQELYGINVDVIDINDEEF